MTRPASRRQLAANVGINAIDEINVKFWCQIAKFCVNLHGDSAKGRNATDLTPIWTTVSSIF